MMNYSYLTIITSNDKEIYRGPFEAGLTPEIALAKMIEAGCKADGPNAVIWHSPDGKLLNRFRVIRYSGLTD